MENEQIKQSPYYENIKSDYKKIMKLLSLISNQQPPVQEFCHPPEPHLELKKEGEKCQK